MFVLGKLFELSLMFPVKAIIRVKLLSGGPLKGKLLALSTNITLGWKGLLGTNTLAYYKNL